MSVVRIRVYRETPGLAPRVLREITLSAGSVAQMGGFEGPGALMVMTEAIDPTPPNAPSPPPRELEAMATHEVAAYLATRIETEADERRWDAMGEDL